MADFFIENQGQLRSPEILYYSTEGDVQIGFGRTFVVLRVADRAQEGGPAPPLPSGADRPVNIVPARYAIVRLEFEGALIGDPRGIDEAPHHTHFFLGNDPSQWRTDVRSFRGVAYEDLYPGIDLRYRTSAAGLKYEFLVRPGADPSTIRVSVQGAEALEVAPDALTIGTRFGTVRDQGLDAFQGADEVTCAFAKKGLATFGFSCDALDAERPLVIDPLIYMTYLGGSRWDHPRALAADRDGALIVAGGTDSIDFPVTPGAYDTSLNVSAGQMSNFIAKLDSTGGELLFATFLGGSTADAVNAVAMDESGAIYAAGHTYSPDFPTTTGAFDPTFNGNVDVWVAKLSPGGDALLFSTFLGGCCADHGTGVAIDGSGNAYVTGSVGSNDFPTTSGAYDRTYTGGEAFVSKLDPSGRLLLYSTLLGGSHEEVALGLAVDGNGAAIVAGITGSADFPVTPGAFDTTYAGGCTVYGGCGDGFVARVSPNGSDLDFGTYLGGADGIEAVTSIARDPLGFVYVTGRTDSADFPTTPGAYDRTFNGKTNDGGDTFVTKLDPDGRTLSYSSFLGGSGADWGRSIDVSPDGRAWVVGDAGSTDFPVTTDALYRTDPGREDGFLANFDAAGTKLAYSTYLGGSDLDLGMAVEVTASAVYAGTYTSSSDLRTTSGAFDQKYDGGSDAYLVGIQFVTNRPPTVLSFSASPGVEGAPVTLTVSAADPDGAPLTYAFDFESDGIVDTAGPDAAVDHIYGDDFTGFAAVRVSDGSLSVTATTPVPVANAAPTVRATARQVGQIDLTLRIAGEKWHEVAMTIFEDGIPWNITRLTRLPGSPDDQSATISGLDVENRSIVVEFTPSDDPVNGQDLGATPAWLTLRSGPDHETRLHHTFTVRHPATWTWDVGNLTALVPTAVELLVSAWDPGSDDLTILVDWGDGATSTTTVFANGVGPDPFPSTDVLPVTVNLRLTHVFSTAGSHLVEVRVVDDDGGATVAWLTTVG